MLGRITRTPAGHRLRFERHLDRPVERVWAALAEPEQRAAWFFAGTLELEAGGRVELRDSAHGVTGSVTEATPPRRLRLTWSSLDAPTSVVSVELEDAQTGCLLTLTQDVDATGRPGNLAAGWHCLLDDLRSHLAGEAMTAAPGRYLELKEQYASALPE